MKRCCRVRMGTRWPSVLSHTFTGCANVATHYALIGKININGYCDECWPDFKQQVKELNKEEVFVAKIMCR